MSRAGNPVAESPRLPILVRAATERDLPYVIDIHLEAFRGFFLSQLGKRFLKELYTGFFSETGTIFLVAADEGGIVGFAVGTVNPDGFFRKLLLRRWDKFLVAATPTMLRNPLLVIRKLVSAVAYRGDRPRQLHSGALLSSIAVAPHSAGRGIGQLLIEAFAERAQELGTTFIYLITDRDDNDAVNRFYRQTGFVLEGELFKAGRRAMNRYIKQIRFES
jgi:ribosomal protein S18 acetylase RimI-like enzyme